MDLTKLYKDCVEFWGEQEQLDILQEECAELIEAVSHYRRQRDGSKKELLEEMADVLLILNQMIEHFGPTNVYAIAGQKAMDIKAKLERQKNER